MTGGGLGVVSTQGWSPGREAWRLVLTPADYDVIVAVGHPCADIETAVRHWIETGPGLRHFVMITAARRSNGDPVPLEAIPLQYHNSPEGRRLQRLGLLAAPLGVERPDYGAIPRVLERRQRIHALIDDDRCPVPVNRARFDALNWVEEFPVTQGMRAAVRFA